MQKANMDEFDMFLDEQRDAKDVTGEVHEVISQRVSGHMPVAKGDWSRLSKKIQSFVGHWVSE